MAGHSDSRNHYKALGLTPVASPEDIKIAFRKLAKELHPDRHPDDPGATAKFQALNEAYSILSDRKTRQSYDAECVVEAGATNDIRKVQPLFCSACGGISAQPRHLTFPYVMSLLVATWRRSFQGIYCPACATGKAAQASAISWLLGWWGVPFGPIHTLRALYENLTMRNQSANVNGRILGRQALYFWGKGKPELAAAMLGMALKFKLSPPIRQDLRAIRDALPPVARSKLIDRWSPWKAWGFWVQLLPVLALAGGLLVWSEPDLVGDVVADFREATAERELAHVVGTGAYVLKEPNFASPRVATVRPFENFHVLKGLNKGPFMRVLTANGTLGYLSTGYVVYGEGQANLTRLCFPSGQVNPSNGEVLRQTRVGPHTLKVTNRQPSDGVVKLRNAAGQTVIALFVASQSEASISTVPGGLYTIEFAMGREFSPACGYFMRDMSSARFSNVESIDMQFRDGRQHTTTLAITLPAPGGGGARVIPTDNGAFVRD